jgi:hypothetical protein
VVLLPWCEPNGSTYDIEAVIALQPTSIVMVYEPLGCAAGTAMHQWLRQLGQDASPESRETPLSAQYADKLPTFKRIYERHRFQPASTIEYTSLLWLARGSLNSGWRTDRVRRSCSIANMQALYSFFLPPSDILYHVLTRAGEVCLFLPLSFCKQNVRVMCLPKSPIQRAASCEEEATKKECMFCEESNTQLRQTLNNTQRMN